MSNFLLSLLFPKYCVGCRRMGKYLCDHCVKAITFITQPICPMCGRAAIGGQTHPRCQTPLALDGLLTPVLFTPTIKALVHQLKYRLVRDLVSCAADLIATHQEIARRLGRLHQDHFTLVPVPLHPARQRWRGFNQAAILAEAIGKRYSLPCQTQFLERIVNTRPQVELAGDKRRANVKGVFQIGHSQNTRIRGQRFILVDDLFTTGSTMRECAKVLKRSGAAAVWGLTLARTGQV